MSGATFDAGGLIALDENDRRVVALLARAAELGARITIPATALAQAVRKPSQQVRLARLLRQPTTAIVPLDGADATQVGLLLARSRTTDIADAHVVICARRNGELILTSDPGDLGRLDPGARFVVVQSPRPRRAARPSRRRFRRTRGLQSWALRVPARAERGPYEHQWGLVWDRGRTELWPRRVHATVVAWPS